MSAPPIVVCLAKSARGTRPIAISDGASGNPRAPGCKPAGLSGFVIFALTQALEMESASFHSNTGRSQPRARQIVRGGVRVAGLVAIFPRAVGCAMMIRFFLVEAGGEAAVRSEPTPPAARPAADLLPGGDWSPERQQAGGPKCVFASKRSDTVRRR